MRQRIAVRNWPPCNVDDWLCRRTKSPTPLSHPPVDRQWSHLGWQPSIPFSCCHDRRSHGASHRRCDNHRPGIVDGWHCGESGRRSSGDRAWGMGLAACAPPSIARCCRGGNSRTSGNRIRRQAIYWREGRQPGCVSKNTVARLCVKRHRGKSDCRRIFLLQQTDPTECHNGLPHAPGGCSIGDPRPDRRADPCDPRHSWPLCRNH